MSKRPRRSEVPVAQTWNLEDMYATKAAWEADLAAVDGALARVTAFKGTLGTGAGALLGCLQASESLLQLTYKVSTYADLKSAEDGTNPENQARSARAAAMQAKVAGGTSFVKSEILQLSEGTIEQYRQEEPGLAAYNVFLNDVLDERPHRLSPETEAVLAQFGEVFDAPYLTYERCKSSDMQFPKVTLPDGTEVEANFAEYEGKYDRDPNAQARRSVYAAFSKGLATYQNTLATTFATEIKKNVVAARVRGYRSAEEMFLKPQHVPVEAYRNILSVIQEELAPHMRRFMNLKKRRLGLEKFYHCDAYAPLDPGFTPKTTWAEASDLILDALSAMGPEYTKIMRTGLRERWCDLPDNVGKSTGAFCHGAYGSHPYILITWNDSMRDAFVMAHELGHAGHFVLASRHQRVQNVWPSLFFVEAPSTINELFLARHIMKGTSDVRMRRWVIEQSLGTFYHNFVTHLLEGELQHRIYGLAEAGEPITAETLTATKGDILRNFWGDAMEIDEAASLTWMRQPHYYLGLYPYTYSAGLSAACAVAEQIWAEGAPAVERWLNCLRAGGSLKPLELMDMAGVDMRKPDAVRSAVTYVGSLVDELEKSYQA